MFISHLIRKQQGHDELLSVSACWIWCIQWQAPFLGVNFPQQQPDWISANRRVTFTDMLQVFLFSVSLRTRICHNIMGLMLDSKLCCSRCHLKCEQFHVTIQTADMDSTTQIWAGGSDKTWRSAHCNFKWLQETRASTYVMGFPLRAPQEQEVPNMGMCLLTSTPVYSFPVKGSNTLGDGGDRQAFLSVAESRSSGMVFIPGARSLKIDRNMFCSCSHYCYCSSN